jgi:hypothetical protein
MTLLIAWLAGTLLLLGGCAHRGEDGTEASANFLGPNAVYILSAPTRIEGWNFQRGDGSTASDPGLRPLDAKIGKELAKVLLAGNTYSKPAGLGGFEPAVGYRVWRENQSADVICSFANDQVLLKYPAYNGNPTSATAGTTAARAELLKIAHDAFPDYRPPAK